jgi:hypothetical protein
MVIGFKFVDVIPKGRIFEVLDGGMKPTSESVEMSFVVRISCTLPHSTCSPFFYY